MEYSGAVVDPRTRIDTDLRPQRPRPVREQPELAGHLLEPAWKGQRVLVRVGQGGPAYVGYDGPIEGSRELHEAISAEARCRSAIFDGVLVAGWEDERELEVDDAGNAFLRGAAGHTIFSAFDLLEVDGDPLLDVPLLERKRHLEGVLAPSRNVRITAYVTRGLRAWRETLSGLGFARVVLKDWNSTYSPGETAGSWLVVDKLTPQRAK